MKDVLCYQRAGQRRTNVIDRSRQISSVPFHLRVSLCYFSSGAQRNLLP